MKKITAFLLALALSFTLIFVVACDETETPEASSSVSATVDDNSSTANSDSTEDKQDKVPAEGLWKDAIYRNDATLGKGEKSFTLTVEIDGKSVNLSIKTGKTTVGEALVELGLIEGEESQYGLYVKKVNGILADYDVDQTYWAFYINGEYAMSGVDTTDITNGATYKLSREG